MKLQINATQTRSMSTLIDQIAWTLLFLLFVMNILDFSGDYAVLAYLSDLSFTNQLSGSIRYITAGLTLSLVGLSCLRILFLIESVRWSIRPLLFVTLILMAYFIGSINAFIRDVPLEHIFGDSRVVAIYLAAFAFAPSNLEVTTKRIIQIISLVLIISFAKLGFAIAKEMVIQGYLGGRFIIRASPTFLVSFFCFFSLFLFSPTKRYLWLAFSGAALLGLLLANMRGLFVGAAFGAMFFFWIVNKHAKNRIAKYLIMLLPLGIIAIGTVLRPVILSIWAWNTSIAANDSIDYRRRQLDYLMDRLIANPIFGHGLGSFDPTYEGNIGGLSRPYLLELEYLNLLTKLGLIGFVFFFAAFLVFWHEGHQLAKYRIWFHPSSNAVLVGLLSGIFSSCVASITNTYYSSIMFHCWILLGIILFRSYRKDIREAKAAAHFAPEY